MATKPTLSNVKLGAGTPSISVAVPKNVSAAAVSLNSLTGHTLERWADGTWWDTTANAPVCVDKLGLTGTPRFQD